MHAFEYRRPASVAEAVALLAADEDAKVLSGGMTLIPTLKQRLASPSALVDLSAIPGLTEIVATETGLTIGGMTRHAAVAHAPLVKATIPALAALAESIGDPQVRNRGTIGGSIANHDPAADYPAGVLGLGATVVTDRREIPADDFFTGLFGTALAPDELVTAVKFPKPLRAAYRKFAQPASRFALVGVFVAETKDGVRVAVTGAGAGVFRVPSFEAALNRDFAPGALEGLTIDAADLNSDMHGDADYRAHLVGVMAKRAVADCLA